MYRNSGQTRFEFDGQKLIYHWDRLFPYLLGEDVAPIYIEISPTSMCNHRCIFCAYDYIGYPKRKLDTARTLKLLEELKNIGVKSLLWAGEGEPLLHKDLPEIIKKSHNLGIDNGIYTNGELLSEEISRRILPYLVFIRVSINGGSEEVYSQVHRRDKKVFSKVLRNLDKAVEIKQKENLKVDIGVQIVVLKENLKTIPMLSRILRDIGVDYLAIKPFVQHPSQKGYKINEQFKLSEIDDILKEAESYSNSNYSVIARRLSFEKYTDRPYVRCYGIHFYCVIGSDGKVFSCNPYWGYDDFCYGDIYKESFQKIWYGERRKSVVEFIENKLDARLCMPNCRLDAVNRFLWELKNPSVKHINFI